MINRSLPSFPSPANVPLLTSAGIFLSTLSNRESGGIINS